MNILIVCTADIGSFPPIINLMDNLINNGHKLCIIAQDDNRVLERYSDLVNSHKITSYLGHSFIKRIIYRLNKARKIRKLVNECMVNNDILWTTTDTTVCILGSIVFKYKHVMQLMELIDDVPLWGNNCLLKFHIDKFANRAWKVIVPEYNRAHIQRTLWGLKKLPVILPNKPYLDTLPTYNAKLKRIIDNMMNERRKIVLYQGVFYEDRKLDNFAQVITERKEYCLYIMGKDSDIRRKLCEKYPEIVYIPYIVAPYHLWITSCASIGLLPYVPEKSFHYSKLNALYCAPNKIFEYSKYGLPMIGSDVPGLQGLFETKSIGICCDINNKDSINKALSSIEDNYDIMSSDAKKFYDSINLDRIVNEEILECN